MNLYYYSNNYPEERCIINIIDGFNYVYSKEAKGMLSTIDRIINGILFRISKSRKEKTLTTYYFSKRNGVFHSFNYCIMGRNKWIGTFESIIPRNNLTRSLSLDSLNNGYLNQDTKHGLDALASDNCLALFALSECTKKIQMSALNTLSNYYNPVKCTHIANKITVLHPPQKLMITENDIRRKFSNLPIIEFLFVGNDFFRKGGVAIIDALSRYAETKKFHLTIVSDLSYDDYATKTDKATRDRCVDIIKNTPWITWYYSISNEKVLELCKSSHIGLLPTFADTYGYSVLEMQASGCPVITTDIRALPEINNNSCGWIIHLPHNELGEASYSNPNDICNNYNTVTNQLDTIFNNIFHTDISELTDKALASYNRIQSEHDPVQYSDTLKRVIQDCCH